MKQAAKEKPRKELCEASAKGLIEAAEALGSIAEPVVKAVKALMNLLFP